MKCLVTGGGGFLGSEITLQLLIRGNTVRVLLKPGETASNLNGLEVETRIGDVRVSAALRKYPDLCS